MPASTPTPVERATVRCDCGAAIVPTADRGRRLLILDRAVDAGQVTSGEAAERRVQLLSS